LTPNIGFDSDQSNNLVQDHGSSACCYPESGKYFLYMGQEYGEDSTLSQTFSDVGGANYTVSFWAYDMGTGGGYYSPIDFFDVSVGNNPGIILYGSVEVQNSYLNYTFTFKGTGSDTLTIAAQDDYCCWVTDNFSVSGPTVGTVPEPSTWLTLTLGFGPRLRWLSKVAQGRLDRRLIVDRRSTLERPLRGGLYLFGAGMLIFVERLLNVDSGRVPGF
jgi:hypothetical protein